jgi:phospholipid transport system substrate-binding protein
MRRLWITALAWLCLAGTAFAITPLERTRSTLEQARVIVDSDRTHNQKLDALRDLLKDFLDTDTMGRNALADNWKKFSPAQQKEFLSLFRELFQRTYVQKLLLFDKPDFAYVGEEKEGDGMRVDTKIITPRDEFAVTYQMVQKNGTWMATDIQIEDLSLTRNFRQQLGRLLDKSSVENVLGRMRRKYGSAKEGGKGGDEDL